MLAVCAVSSSVPGWPLVPKGTRCMSWGVPSPWDTRSLGTRGDPLWVISSSSVFRWQFLAVSTLPSHPLAPSLAQGRATTVPGPTGANGLWAGLPATTSSLAHRGHRSQAWGDNVPITG